MNAHATLTVPSAESSLGRVLAALAPHDDKALILDYGDGKQVQGGYHVTEVKAGSFVTLDCGANPDSWQETILQIEDIPAGDNGTFMTVGKFAAILREVDRRVRLNAEARLTVEIGFPDEPMRIFDVARIAIDGDAAILELGARPAICKPRHRAAQRAAACCAPSTASACCP